VRSDVDDKGVLWDGGRVDLVGLEEDDELGSSLGGGGRGGEADVIGGGSRSDL
jgi:hypothetical protein